MRDPVRRTYYMNEAAFELPDLAFTDRTVTALDAAAPDGGELGIRVHRTPLPAGKTLRDVVLEHVAEATRALPAYALLWQRDAELSGVPAIELAARFRGASSMSYSRQAHLAVDGSWLLFSCNGALADLSSCDACLEHVVASLRFAR